MRAFLAVDIDENLVEKIVKVQREIIDSDAPLKMVEPENLHLTFKFFGEINQRQKEEIVSRTHEKLDSYEPFSMDIMGCGVFPHLGYIRVIWLGFEDPGSFPDIQRTLDREYVEMGFKKERNYTPHLTIGRVKGARNKEILIEKIKGLKDVKIGKTMVQNLVLKKSELTPSGPIYNDLEEFRL